MTLVFNPNDSRSAHHHHHFGAPLKAQHLNFGRSAPISFEALVMRSDESLCWLLVVEQPPFITGKEQLTQRFCLCVHRSPNFKVSYVQRTGRCIWFNHALAIWTDFR